MPWPFGPDDMEPVTVDPNMKKENVRPMGISGLGNMTKTNKAHNANTNALLRRGKLGKVNRPPLYPAIPLAFP